MSAPADRRRPKSRETKRKGLQGRKGGKEGAGEPGLKAMQRGKRKRPLAAGVEPWLIIWGKRWANCIRRRRRGGKGGGSKEGREEEGGGTAFNSQMKETTRTGLRGGVEGDHTKKGHKKSPKEKRDGTVEGELNGSLKISDRRGRGSGGRGAVKIGEKKKKSGTRKVLSSCIRALGAIGALGGGKISQKKGGQRCSNKRRWKGDNRIR